MNDHQELSLWALNTKNLNFEIWKAIKFLSGTQTYYFAATTNPNFNIYCTKMEFSGKDFFRKCEEILKKSLMEEILKKSLMENFILCAVIYVLIFVCVRIFQSG